MRLSLLAPLDRWLAPAPPADRVAWLRKACFAHRGLYGHGLAENSLGAAEAAIAKGLGIECDVQRSSDGQAVVFHDWELDRLTAERGMAGDRSAAQLGALTLSGTSDTIPTLRHLLDVVAGRVPLLIELKSRRDRRFGALCLAVRRVLEGYRGPHAIMSFDPRIAHWFAVNSPQTVRGLVVTEENDKALPGRLRRHFALWHARPDFLSYDIRDLPGRFPAAQRRRGLPLVTWTIGTPELLARSRACADAPTVEGAGVP